MSVVKPSVTKKMINIRSEDLPGAAPVYQVAAHTVEVVSATVTKGKNPITVRFYEGTTTSQANSKLLLAANNNDTAIWAPCQPHQFNGGVLISFEQGGDPGDNGEVSIQMNDG